MSMRGRVPKPPCCLPLLRDVKEVVKREMLGPFSFASACAYHISLVVRRLAHRFPLPPNRTSRGNTYHTLSKIGPIGSKLRDSHASAHEYSRRTRPPLHCTEFRLSCLAQHKAPLMREGEFEPLRLHHVSRERIGVDT